MPDDKRVLIHMDLDAFYAQTEEIRDPSLRQRPLAVTQKYLCVTSNYVARRHGVSKLMSIRDAQACCPALVLVSGEDLTPYRRASRAVLSVLSRFGEVEKGGMDEAFVDVTREAAVRVGAGDAGAYHGHRHTSETELQRDNPHRAVDLRACVSAAPMPDQPTVASGPEPDWAPLLRAGSAIAAEARAAVKLETGFRMSAGIACNKMLAKLVSGLHKPDDQTVLLPSAAEAFVAQLPLRAIPGIGRKMDQQLESMGLRTVAHLQQVPLTQLITAFGERIGTFLFEAALGQDSSPIKPLQPPKAVTVEDSFKSCSSPAAAAHVMKVLAPDFLARLLEEYEEHGRRPTKFQLKWRLYGGSWRDGHSRASASCPMPPVVGPPFKGAVQAAAIEKAAMTLLTRNTVAPFNLTLLNLGATNFVGGATAPACLLPIVRHLRPSTPNTFEAPDVIEGDPQSITAAHFAAKAAAATAARRDYGAAPTGAALSKQHERLLRENGCHLAAHGRPTARLATASASPESAPCHLATCVSDSDSDCKEDEWADIRRSSRLCSSSGDQPGLDKPADGGPNVLSSLPIRNQTAPEHARCDASAAGDAVSFPGMLPVAVSNVPSASAAATAVVPSSPPLSSATAAAEADETIAEARPAEALPKAAETEVIHDLLSPEQAGPLSQQLAADFAVAQRLQQEEAELEARRRRQSRDAFLSVTIGCAAPGSRKRKQQRASMEGTLERFFRRQ